MVLKQLVVFADSDVSLRLETVADQAAISSNTVSPAPLRIRRSTVSVINSPESLLSINGIRVATGNNQYFDIRANAPFFLKLPEFLTSWEQQYNC